MNFMEQACNHLTDYHIDQINHLVDKGMIEEATAMYDELKEWIESPGQHEIFTCGYLN